MTRIYLDTNILLHGKPLQDITWESYEQVPITIIITSTNLRELDHHKDQHPKKHLRERARRALQRIEESLEESTLRPSVTLHVEDKQPLIDYPSHHLDPYYADDQLLASTIASCEEHPDETTILYTHDVGPRIKAKKRGITTRSLNDTDKLPPTKDETEAENERLRREIHEITTAAPRLKLTINGDTTDVIVTTLAPTPAPLDEAALRHTAAEAHAALPAFDLTSIPEDIPPSSRRNKEGRHVLVLDTTAPPPDLTIIPRSEYARYEDARANYLTQYENHLRQTHEACERIARTIKLDLGFTNDGGKPAEEIYIEITLPANWEVHLAAPGIPRLPVAPPMPRTRSEVFAEHLVRVPSLSDYPRNDLLYPGLNPWHSGPNFEGHAITWRRKSLNHGFNKSLSTLYLTAVNNLTPIAINYSIHAANSINPFEGKILVTPQRRGVPPDKS